MAKDQLPLCHLEGGFLAKKRVNDEGQTVDCVPFQRDDSAIREHLQGRTFRGGPMGTYANNAMLRAMAASRNVFLVTINTATLSDICVVYPPECSTRTVVGGGWSWAEEVAPKLLRQQCGEADGSSPPVKVILWNGRKGSGGHFDATVVV